ncbi:MAG: alpha/beta hydrolase [Bdellovibrionales bacterium]|nr:alpha/beta hydrolase [Bdellovibrionales bacterium]
MKNLEKNHRDAGLYFLGFVLFIYGFLLISLEVSAGEATAQKARALTLSEVVAAQSSKSRAERVEGTELIDKEFHWKVDGENVTGHLYKPKGDKLAAVLVLPGRSGQVTAQTKVFCEKMRRKGYVVLALDYSQVDLESAKETSRAITESLGWMEELVYVDATRIGIVGTLPGELADHHGKTTHKDKDGKVLSLTGL